MLDDPGFKSRKGEGNFSFPNRPDWVCAQPSLFLFVPDYIAGTKRPGREVDHFLHHVPRLRMRGVSVAVHASLVSLQGLGRTSVRFCLTVLPPEFDCPQGCWCRGFCSSGMLHRVCGYETNRQLTLLDTPQR